MGVRRILVDPKFLLDFFSDSNKYRALLFKTDGIPEDAKLIYTSINRDQYPYQIELLIHSESYEDMKLHPPEYVRSRSYYAKELEAAADRANEDYSNMVDRNWTW